MRAPKFWPEPTEKWSRHHGLQGRLQEGTVDDDQELGVGHVHFDMPPNHWLLNDSSLTFLTL